MLSGCILWSYCIATFLSFYMQEIIYKYTVSNKFYSAVFLKGTMRVLI